MKSKNTSEVGLEDGTTEFRESISVSGGTRRASWITFGIPVIAVLFSVYALVVAVSSHHQAIRTPTNEPPVTITPQLNDMKKAQETSTPLHVVIPSSAGPVDCYLRIVDGTKDSLILP